MPHCNVALPRELPRARPVRDQPTGRARIFSRPCEAALRGGAAMLQYRDKSGDARRAVREARAFVALCARHGVPLDRQRRRRIWPRQSAPPACIWARTTAIIAAARAQLGAARDHRRVLLRLARPRARSRRGRRGLSRVRRVLSFADQTARARARRSHLLRDAQVAGPAAGGDRRHYARQCAAAGRRRRRFRRRRFPALFGARDDPRAQRGAIRRLVHNAKSASMTSNHELFQRALKLMPGGVNSPVRAFKSVGGEPFFTAARRRRLSVGCRRQALHRLRRLVGADDRRPQSSACARSGRTRGARRAVVRHAVCRRK